MLDLETPSRPAPCAATAMRKASRRLSQLYDDALQPAGIKSTQFAILAELNARGRRPPTMMTLAHALVLDRTALRHNLGPLQRDGYIAFLEDETDGRKRLVALTVKGSAKYGEARELWKVAQDRFFAIVGRSSGEALRAHLLAIAHDERLGTLSDRGDAIVRRERR